MSLTYLDEDSILSNYAGKPSGQHNFNHGSRIYKRLNRSEASPRNVSLKSPSHNESKNHTYFYISQRSTSVSKEKQSQKKLKTRGRTKADDDTRKSKYDKPTRISVLSHDLDDSSLILSPKIEPCNKSRVEPNKTKELLRNLIRSKKKDTRTEHVQANSKLALFSPYSSTLDPTLAAHSASIVSFSRKIRADSSKKRTLLKQDSHSSEKRMNASAGQSMHKLPKVVSQSQDSEVCDDRLNKTAPFRTTKTKNSSMQNSFIDSRSVIASPSTKINERPPKSRKEKSILEDLKLPRTGSMPSRITDMSFENEISIEAQDKSLIYTPDVKFVLDTTNDYHSHNSPSKSKGIEEKITHKQKSTGEFEKSQIDQQNYPPKSAAQKVYRIIKVFSIESKHEADKKGNKNIPTEENIERGVAKKSELQQPIKNCSRPQSPPKSILQKEMTYQHSPKFSRPEEPPKMSINERYEQLLKGNIEEKFSELERIFRGKKNRKKVSFSQI